MADKTKRKKLKIFLFLSFPLLFIILFAILITAVMVNIIGGTSGGGAVYNASHSETIPVAVLNYIEEIKEAAGKYGIEDYTPILLAICTLESGGLGTDIFGIGDETILSASDSIDKGVAYFKDLLNMAGLISQTGQKNTAPKLNPTSSNNSSVFELYTAIQCYDYGSDYYTWIKSTTAGYGHHSRSYAISYKELKAETDPEWSGNPDYLDEIRKYWDSETNTYKSRGVGSNAMVIVSLNELGNKGGEKFWRYMGFSSRVAWCASFVSWVADQCGYIDAGIVECTAVADPSFYVAREQYYKRTDGYLPGPGDLVYFDWEQNDDMDHVGIVEKVENGVLYTIEGNQGDMVVQLTYDIHDPCIDGYACPNYPSS